MAVLGSDFDLQLQDAPDVVAPRRRRTPDAGGHRGVADRVRRHTLRRLMVADVIGLALAAFLGPLIISALSDNPNSSVARSGAAYLFDLAMIPVFVTVFAVYGLYRGTARRISTSVFSDLRNILHALIISGFVYAVATYVAKRALGIDEVTVAKIAAMCAMGVVTVPLARVAAFGLLGRASEGSVPVIVVGTGKLAETVANHLRAHSTVDFVGFVDDNPLGNNDVIGELDELPDLCREHRVARVVVCFSRTHPERTTEMLKTLTGQVGVSIVPRYYELITARSHVEDLSGLPMLDIAPASLSAGARFLKRSFDIAVSSLVLLAVSPAILVMAVLIKATSAGPVFFRQVRTGRGEQPFSMMKFRTMYHDAESAPARARAPQRDGRPPVQGPRTIPGSPGWVASCAGPASTRSPS